MKKDGGVIMCSTEMSDFYCVFCGKQGLPVWRKKGNLREAGHLKKLYCLHCKCQTNHAEVKPYTYYDYEKFKMEYEYGNFDKEGNRILTIGQLKEAIRNGKVKKIRTLDDGGSSGEREE
jgi:hypothetical protein